MPRAKKTTAPEATAPAPKQKATRAKAKTPAKAAAPKSTSAANKKVSDIEKRLTETENRLNALISVIHNDLSRGQLHGPEGLASKLKKAGLLDQHNPPLSAYIVVGPAHSIQATPPSCRNHVDTHFDQKGD